MLVMLLLCAFKAGAQLAMPDNVCIGATKHYNVEPNPVPGSTYTWKIDGVTQASTTNSIDITWNTLGNYLIEIQELTASGCLGPVQAGEVFVSTLVPASVWITANQTAVCSGTSVTFTATPVNGGTTPFYQWMVNNINIGINSTAFSYVPSNGDKFTVLMTSNESCASGSPAISNELSININPLFPASVSISADRTTVCEGTSVTFLATSENGGLTPSYQWKVNGTAIGTDSNGYSFVPKNGDKISVEMTSSESCVSGSPATSNELAITVNSLLPASVSIAASQTSIYAGTLVIFTATPVNGGTAPVYQWSVNGANTGSNSDSYSYAPVNGDSVSVVMTSSETCATDSPATSNLVTISVSPALIASVTIVADQNNVCAGTVVLFTALPVNGGTTPAYRWKVNGVDVGADSPDYSYTPADGDVVELEMTSDLIGVSGNPASSIPLPMTINLPLKPNFDPITPMCAGSENPLPATSLEGITGTWSPIFDNAQTTTYTFTPTVGQCAVEGSVTVTIASGTVPTFATIAPMCAGGANPLTATSLEGITGTWSPAFDNTTTTTYTFTPTAGQCAVDGSATVTIASGTVPTFAIIAPMCAGGADPLPATSLEGITGTWSPAFDNAQTTTYTFTPTAGQCAVDGSATVAIASGTVPTFAIIAPMCAGGANPLPGTSLEGITGSWSPAFDNTTTTTYTFTPTAGQCAVDGITTIIVNTAPTPPMASVTVQPSCSVTTGTITVSGPTGAAYEYSIDDINYQSSPTFTGVVPNNYAVTVRSSADPTCVFAATLVTVNSGGGAPAAPTASVTVQPSCSVYTGTITVSGPTGAAYEYSIDDITYQSSPTFTGAVPNTYSVTVRNIADPTCVSAATLVTVNSGGGAPAAPTASVTVQPSCSVATGTIAVSAPTGAAYEYSIDDIIYQSSPTFTGVVPNTYSVTVRNSADPTCVSAAALVTVNSGGGAPAAPTASVTVQPSCSVATGTITVSEPIGTAYEYSIDDNNYQSSATFTGAVPNTYAVTVRNSADPTCVSAATLITVNSGAGAPAAPIANVTVQPSCSVNTGTITVSGPTGAAYEYSIDDITYQSSPTFTGVAPNNYAVTVRNSADPTCVSAATLVTVNSGAGAPAAPTASVTVQPSCSVNTGTITVSAPIGAAYEYSIDDIIYQSSPTFTGVVPNTYSVTVRSSADPTCVSAAALVTVNSGGDTPSAPLLTKLSDPTCFKKTASIQITGLPNSGEWILTRTPGGITKKGTGDQTIISGLLSRTYSFIVENNLGCISAPSSKITINPAPITPSAPLVETITQPTCETDTASVSLTGLPASGTWTLTRTPDGVTTTGTGTKAIIPGLVAGTYSFIVTNETECVSTSSVDIVINQPPLKPTAPIVEIIAQPSCAIPSGTVVLSGLPPTGAWTLTRTPGEQNTNGSGVSDTIRNIPEGTYTFVLVNEAGCSSIISSHLEIVPVPLSTPLFDPIRSLIQNSVPPLLPDISKNNIHGTWDPATISTSTAGKRTYTFTPDPSECAARITLEITVTIQAVISTEGTLPSASGISSGSCANLNLSGSASAGKIVKYEWSLVDQGGILEPLTTQNTTFKLSPTYSGSLPADFKVRLLVTDSLGYTDSDSVTIHINPPPVAALFSSGELQKDGSMVVDGSVSTGNDIKFKWSTTEGEVVGASDQPTVKFFGSGMYRLTITDAYGCQNIKDFKFPLELYTINAVDDYYRISWDQDTILHILANDSTSSPFINGSVQVIKQPKFGIATANSNNTITYIPTIRKPATEIFEYRVSNIELSDSATVTIDIFDSKIKFPQGFSPNGDGKNDLLVFEGLESYRPAGLYIFTRAGEPVYQSADYQNNWNGTTKDQGAVPTGTYYYVLKLGQTNRVIKGFIYIGY